MLRGTQRFLWAIGFLVLGYCGTAWFNARLQQQAANRELDRLLSNNSAQTARARRGLLHGALVGRMGFPGSICRLLFLRVATIRFWQRE
jgi:hypothetical protein